MNTPKLNPRRGRGPHTRILEYDPIFAQKIPFNKISISGKCKIKTKNKKQKKKQKKKPTILR